jgi:uncharacterized protein YdiU (UPF0061 family)
MATTLDFLKILSSDFLNTFSGTPFIPIPNCLPYAGHQFGIGLDNWNGRAINLTEVVHEIRHTLYNKKVLGLHHILEQRRWFCGFAFSIREYLCAEAMHYWEFTTRSLSLCFLAILCCAMFCITEIQRMKRCYVFESGAIVYICFGSFEILLRKMMLISNY